MKKLSLPLLFLSVIYLLMTFFVGKIAEREIKIALPKSTMPDLSVELLSYTRHFFSATANSKISFRVDPETTITLNVNSTISHYPHQAVIKSEVQLADQQLAESAKKYFNTTSWLISEERIDIFSRLTGELKIVAGRYETASESLLSEPVQLNYQIDLKSSDTMMQLDWAGLTGTNEKMSLTVNGLQFSSTAENSERERNDYNLMIKEVLLEEKGGRSLLESFTLKGSRELGKTAQTFDMSNEIQLKSYQFNGVTNRSFVNNHLTLMLTGLYQPAFELLNGSSDDSEEIEDALVELIHNGMQVSLSEFHSQTPWGKVDGSFDITLHQGASLSDIMANPYILFDYINGDANIVLPAALLGEPTLSEPLQVGLMTGFLLQEEETLNLQTSFQQGELVVNGKVIPL